MAAAVSVGSFLMKTHTARTHKKLKYIDHTFLVVIFFWHCNQVQTLGCMCFPKNLN